MALIVRQGGTVRSVTAGGRGQPTNRPKGARDHVYDLVVPRGLTAGGPHGVYPGTGHVARVGNRPSYLGTRGGTGHPQGARPAFVAKGPPIPRPGRGNLGRPPGLITHGGPPATPPGQVHVPPGVVVNPPGPSAGAITEVGGFINQTNAGGTTSGVGGGSFSPTGPVGTGYFSNLGSGDILGSLGVPWITAVEVAALAVGGYLVWRHYGKGKRGRR